MKKTLLSLFVLSLALNANSTHIIHGFGIGQSDYFGMYSNFTTLNFQYTPQLQKTNGNWSFGLTSPMSIGKYISSARSENNSLLFELPASVELSFNPCGACSNFESYSIFTGLGVSRLYEVNTRQSRGDYYNAYLGIRIPPFKQAIEIRLNYSRSIEYIDNSKLGISVSYLLRSKS